ncbi:DUF1127 domain-containing protein [Rhodovibrionaceae bacterium A322]
MAATAFVSPSALQGSTGVKAAALSVLNTLYTWQARFEQRDQLKNMDARQRTDLHLSAADIDKEVRKAFWQA